MIVYDDVHLYCIVCDDGSFGLDCSEICHCLNNAVCMKETGKCPQSKCAVGWKGMYCQTGMVQLKSSLFYTEM